MSDPAGVQVTRVQVTCTIDSRPAAESLAFGLVEDRLAACVQIVGPITSTYRWEGAVETAEEYLLLVKTTTAALPRLRDAIVARHPYDVPEVLAVPVHGGHLPYLDWIGESVR